MSVAGLVLAAGTGTRLAPLTNYFPKPLLPVLDRTLLELQIERLEVAGCERIFVNLHHHAGFAVRHLERVAPDVVYRVEQELSGPAGTVALFSDLLSDFESVLVTSSDVLVEDNPAKLLQTHREHSAAMTFGVIETSGARRFGVLDIDADGTIRGAREKPDVPDHELHPVSAGVYCLGPEVVALVDRLHRHSPLLDYARDLAPALIEAGSPVAGHRFQGYWRDVGTPHSYLAANRDALAGRIPWFRPRATQGIREAPGGPVFVHPTAVLEPGVTLAESVVVGAGVQVGAGAELSEAVVLPNAVVPPAAVVIGGVIGGSCNPEPTVPMELTIAVGRR